MNLGNYLDLFHINAREEKPIYNHEITDFTDCANNCINGSMFFAIKGINNDGHLFINQAISLGARTIICERYPQELKPQINYVKVKSTKKLFNQTLLYGIKDEIKKIKIVGITGTNGKTTIGSLSYEMLKYLNISSMFIGTNGSFVYYKTKKGFQEVKISTPNTTPKLAVIVDLIKKYPKINYLVMEVSSEALASGRVDYLRFDIVVFSNIGHDHLNTHHNFIDYLNSKLKLFSLAKKNGTAIINLDDSHANNFMKMAEKRRLKIYTYGLIKGNLRGEVLSINKDYMMFKIYSSVFEYVIGTNLIGNFNLLNILASCMIIESENISINHILPFFEKQITIKGRYEKYLINNRIIYIDYAHNPEAILAFIKTINKIKEKKQVITIIGAGGDKDIQKRPKMGEIAAKYSHLVIFTEDNSRTEPVEKIVAEMTKTLKKQNYLLEYNREKAIKKAFQNSQKGDYILLLGMGNDLYKNGKSDLQMAQEVNFDE